MSHQKKMKLEEPVTKDARARGEGGSRERPKKKGYLWFSSCGQPRYSWDNRDAHPIVHLWVSFQPRGSQLVKPIRFDHQKNLPQLLNYWKTKAKSHWSGKTVDVEVYWGDSKGGRTDPPAHFKYGGGGFGKDYKHTIRTAREANLFKQFEAFNQSMGQRFGLPSMIRHYQNLIADGFLLVSQAWDSLVAKQWYFTRTDKFMSLGELLHRLIGLTNDVGLCSTYQPRCNLLEDPEAKILFEVMWAVVSCETSFPYRGKKVTWTISTPPSAQVIDLSKSPVPLHDVATTGKQTLNKRTQVVADKTSTGTSTEIRGREVRHPFLPPPRPPSAGSLIPAPATATAGSLIPAPATATATARPPAPAQVYNILHPLFGGVAAPPRATARPSPPAAPAPPPGGSSTGHQSQRQQPPARLCVLPPRTPPPRGGHPFLF